MDGLVGPGANLTKVPPGYNTNGTIIVSEDDLEQIITQLVVSLAHRNPEERSFSSNEENSVEKFPTVITNRRTNKTQEQKEY